MRQVDCFHFPEERGNRIRVRNAVPDYPIPVSGSPRPCRRQAYNLECDKCCFVATGASAQSPLQWTDTPATSLKEAIERARRHEASGLAGGHVSALYHQMPHRVLDHLAAKPSAQNRSSGARGKGGDNGSGAQRKCAQGRSPSSNRAPASDHPDRVCSYPTCRSKNAHTIDQCWTNTGDQRETGAGASSNGKAKKKKKKKKKRTPRSEKDDDSE